MKTIKHELSPPKKGLSMKCFYFVVTYINFIVTYHAKMLLIGSHFFFEQYYLVCYAIGIRMTRWSCFGHSQIPGKMTTGLKLKTMSSFIDHYYRNADSVIIYVWVNTNLLPFEYWF